MLMMIVLCLLLALAIVLVGSPSWKNPPVGIGMLIAAACAVMCIWHLITLAK